MERSPVGERSRILLPTRLRQTQQIGKEPVSPRHSSRQLPEPCVRGIDVKALAHRHINFSASLFSFTRIVRFKHRRILWIKVCKVKDGSFLNPALPIVTIDLVWEIENRILRFQYRNRSILICHTWSS